MLIGESQILENLAEFKQGERRKRNYTPLLLAGGGVGLLALGLKIEKSKLFKNSGKDKGINMNTPRNSNRNIEMPQARYMKKVYNDLDTNTSQGNNQVVKEQAEDTSDDLFEDTSDDLFGGVFDRDTRGGYIVG